MANSALLLCQDKLGRATSNLQAGVEDQLPYLTVKSFIPGNVTEISGKRSSGKTSLCLHVLAQATARGEVCAVVDMHHSFHPASARAAGIALEQLVWVRCQGDVQHTIRAADLLLHAGGFGVVLLDLCEAPPQALNRIPLSYWYRLRQAVEHTPAILLVCSNSPEAKGSFINKLRLKRKVEHWAREGPFPRLEGWEAAVLSSKALGVQPEHFYMSSVA